jgi:hypothetical protein
MAKVSKTDFYRIPGVYEPVEYVVETYPACDQCGSTNLCYRGNAHIPAFANVCQSVTILSFFGTVIVWFITHNILICGALGMISIIAFLNCLFLVSYIGHNTVCKNCGSQLPNIWWDR